MGNDDTRDRSSSDPTRNLRACIESRERWIKSTRAISARLGSAHDVALAMITSLKEEQPRTTDAREALIIRAQIDALETWAHYFEHGVRSDCLPLGSCTCHAYLFGE